MASQKTHLGHTARKRFGQNFLTDEYVINQIISAIAPKADDNLVEIGPGLGALTYPMLKAAPKLTVVELDRDLAARLKDNVDIQTKITVIEADALQFDFSTLIQDGKAFKLFGNLPYNISTPLLFHLFNFSEHIATMHFMLQKEVVERMVASPGSKAYGRLSVMTQYFCHAMPVLTVPPGSFVPPPKVESAVIRLQPKTEHVLPKEHVETLDIVCKTAFSQRRKTLRNTLKSIISADSLQSLGIDPSQRAETLSLEAFAAIASWVISNRNVDE